MQSPQGARLLLPSFIDQYRIDFMSIINIIDIYMGNTKSEEASNYQQHQRLGEVKLIQSTDYHGNLLEQMMISKPIQSEQQFNIWIQLFNKFNDSFTNQVLLLPNKTVFQSTGMCGSHGILKYEHFPYVFQLELENRRKINRFFLQSELWYLLYNLVRAGSRFQKSQSKIGDIHPNSILMNEDGLIKIISICSFPGQVTNYDKFIDNPHQKVYIAPEQLEHTLGRMEYPKNIDPSLAQCYSIGLTVLAAGTLQDVDSVYTMTGDDKKIQRHKVNFYQKLLGDRYSSYLNSMVMGLLADNPINRKRCSQIYHALYEFEDKILDLEPFMPPNSRLAPTQQFPIYVSQSRASQDPKRVNYVVSGQQRPSSNMFFSHKGVKVNPIESKYVPMSQYQSTQQYLSPHQIPSQPHRL